jgi:hypothetical protein
MFNRIFNERYVCLMVGDAVVELEHRKFCTR